MIWDSLQEPWPAWQTVKISTRVPELLYHTICIILLKKAVFLIHILYFKNLIIKLTKLAVTSISGPITNNKLQMAGKANRTETTRFYGSSRPEIASFSPLDTYEPHFSAWTARAWLYITQQRSNCTGGRGGAHVFSSRATSKKLCLWCKCLLLTF